MRDKIYAYLKLQKTGVTGNELVEQVLKIKGASPDIGEKLIQTAIAGDRRFALDEHRLWKIIEKGGISLTEAEFVFLSLLTIETVDKRKTIVEVSAQKVRDDMLTDQLHVFINPGSSISLPTDLAQEVECGLTAEKAVRLLAKFFGQATLVGYDIQHSINHLNVIFNNYHETIENSPLCVKYLTKKLIPDLHPKSLDDVAAFFKLPVITPRRTEGEVRTIAEIFSRYKDLLKEKGFCTLEEVLAFQYPDIDSVDFSKYAFDKTFLWAIPQKPGIYKMKTKGGEVIYVGKAKNLKARVCSYFWNTEDRLHKTAYLLNNVYTIEYEIAGSELAAMLMEFRLIKQYRPGYNQQLEVHERDARYGTLKNFIVILPSSMERSLELFFMKEGLPLERYEILRDAVNFSGVERILDIMYYEAAGANRCSPLHAKDNKNSLNSAAPYSPPIRGGETREIKISPSLDGRGKGEGEKIFSNVNIQNHNTLTDIEKGEIDIVLSWVDANKDFINYINMDSVCSKEACLKLLKDYIRDEETTQNKHFRFI